MPLSASAASAVRVTVSFTGEPGSRRVTVGGVQSGAAETVLTAFWVVATKDASEATGTPNTASPATSARAIRVSGRDIGSSSDVR